MKKLKLSLQNIEGAELLTRAQLKMVVGGDGSGGSGSGTAGTPGCVAYTTDSFCSAFYIGAYCAPRDMCGIGTFCIRSIYQV